MGWNSLMQEFALDAFTKLDTLVIIIIIIKSPLAGGWGRSLRLESRIYECANCSDMITNFLLCLHREQRGLMEQEPARAIVTS